MKQRLLVCLIFATAILSVPLTIDFASFRVLAARGPIISTIGGGGIANFCGDSGRTTYACVNFSIGFAVDGNNNLLIADTYNHIIRRVSASGTISTVADNGTAVGFYGDGGSATFGWGSSWRQLSIKGIANLVDTNFSFNIFKSL